MQKILFFICLIAFVTSCQSDHKKRLHLFVWEGYFNQELIEEFEKEHDCRVIIDTYDSNESMYAKLKLGQSIYDIVMPSNYIFEAMVGQNMLSKIDFDQVSNHVYVDSKQLEVLGIKESFYGIPYMISYTGLGYRKDRIANFSSSWTIFGNKKYKGRMTMLNDPREVIGAALLTLGYSINTLQQEEVEEAVELVLQWKSNLAKFDGEQYKNGIASGEYLVVQGDVGDIIQVVRDGENVAFAWPEEGAIVSIDYLAIPKGSRNRRLAEKFIDYFLDPQVELKNITFSLSTPLNKKVYSLMSKSLQEQLFPSLEQLEKSEVIRDLGGGLELYLDAWDSIKTRKY